MVVRIKRNRLWFIAVGLLFAVMFTASIFHMKAHKIMQTDTAQNTESLQKTAGKVSESDKKAKIETMRGVWIPYFSLETQEHTEQAFKENYDKLIATAKEHKMNAVIREKIQIMTRCNI